MTIEQLRESIAIWFCDRDFSEENINDFCNMHAGSYEEYMTIYEMLMENLET